MKKKNIDLKAKQKRIFNVFNELLNNYENFKVAEILSIRHKAALTQSTDPERAENKIKMEKEKTRELRKTIYEKSDCCDEF